VEIGSIDIQNLPSGLYNFMISTRDMDTDQTADISKRFYIVKNDLRDMQALAIADDLDNLNEEQLDEAFGPLKYMANDTEIRSFRKSDITGKRTILRKFWSQRDPDPATPINEARIKFERLLQNVNEQFTNSRQKGWKTDMGRVYLVYGPPSEIERHASSLEAKPYQIWHYYEIEGGIIFVFVDKTGFGQMELVHSTGRNELQDYQWERWVSPSPSSSSSYDSY
jgi:GWxTD domain-containing protein